KKILKKNIPVILRVDMRYLPYLWNGEYGDKYTSFGWHFVTLIKLVESGGYAWVTETSEKGIHSIKKIKIADLMKARGSKEGMLKADNYFYYFPEPKSTKINYAAALNSSLEIVLDNYEKKGGVLEGLKKLPDQLKNIEDFISSKYVLEPLFFTFHGYIETFGTGGAAFRNYYRDFLLEAGKITNNPKTKIAASQLDETCKKWENLAAEFSYISKNIKQHYGDKKKRNDLYQKASLLAEELYIAESRFASELRKAYKPL
ncbi:BtrH N-terminal domain-containing protein, partial [bacterium]|nr:BtrH N-terminal domain-containing protein [bacterium]